MAEMRLGIGLWSQATEWQPMLEAARLVDRLGYDHLWVWDHHYAPFGDPYQPILEGWTIASAWAMATEHVTVGQLVAPNPWHHPGLYAKMAITLDHVSGGRAIMGMGAGWWELEADAYGMAFGRSTGERLDWLDESVAAVRRLLDGERVTVDAARFRFRDLVMVPRPVQARLPILIGGGGEKKTLRIVAKYADMWNAFGSIEDLRRKGEVLAAHCEAVGRDPTEIRRSVECKITIRNTVEEARAAWGRRLEANKTPYDEGVDTWLGPPELIAERMAACRDAGFDAVMTWMPAPYDVETIERLIGEVRPILGG